MGRIPKRLLGLCILLLAGCGARSTQITIGYAVGDPGPAVARAIVDVLRAEGMDVELATPYESAEVLAAAVIGGGVDVALLEEPAEPDDHLRALLPLYPAVLHLVYADTLDASDLSSLLAADRIFAGQFGQAGHRLAQDLMAMDGLTDARDRLLATPWDAGPPPSVYFIFGGLLSAEAQAGFTGYRLFSFPGPPGADLASGLALQYPNLHPFTLPAGLYPGLADQPVQTIAVETLLVGRPDLDEQWVYMAVDALRNNPQPLEQVYSLARSTLARSPDGEPLTLALHDGTLRQLEKDAPGFAERYAEFLVLGVTLTVGAFTALIGWWRRRRLRRKDRLDDYLIRLRSLRSAMSVEQPDATLAQVAALEDEVLELMVNERIEADATLLTFFLLSGSVRRDLRG